MASICGVCHGQESKYKCPICELRYCSLNCYKSHKETHDKDPSTINGSTSQPLKDRPGTKQRIPKVDFTGFENDRDLARLLARYPLLHIQLQAMYGLTLEPGPEDARNWNREPLPGFERPPRGGTQFRGRGRGGFRGGRGGGRGGREVVLPEGRQRGQWTQDKGDREALDVMKKMREGGQDEESGEGLREFIQLCQIKFGSARTVS